MKFNRLIIITFLTILVAGSLHAAVPDTTYNWKKLDGLVEQMYYDDAYRMAGSLFERAQKQGLSRESLIAARYMSLSASSYRENAADSALLRYRQLLPTLDKVDQAVCHFYIATYYATYLTNGLSSYYVKNQYTGGVADEASDAGGNEEHPSLWSSQRIMDTVLMHYKAAFADADLLHSQPSEQFLYIVELSSGKDRLDITPTLFDVMAQQYLHDMRSRAEVHGQIAFDYFAFKSGTSEEFVAKPLPAEHDVDPLIWLSIKLLQQVERYHLADADTELLINLAIERIEYPEIGYWQKNLLPLLDRYRNSASPAMARLRAKLAEGYLGEENYIAALGQCDTVVAQFPQSPFAKMCDNMRSSIKYPVVYSEMQQHLPSGQPAPLHLRVRNVDSLYFRIVEGTTDYNNREQKMRNSRPVASWSMAVPSRDDYRGQQLLAIVPPVEQGEYYLMASPTADFKQYGFVYTYFEVSDLDLLPAQSDNKPQQGYVVDRVTGKPVKDLTLNLKVRSYNNEQYKLYCTTKTDEHGYYDFVPALKSKDSDNNSNYWQRRIETEYKGKKLVLRDGLSINVNSGDDEEYACVKFLNDQPIYKPGDTVRTTLVVSITTRGGAVLSSEGIEFRVVINSPNGTNLLADTVVTDAYGAAMVAYVLDEDAMPGRYSLNATELKQQTKSSAIYNYSSFQVEAYKQPKFRIDLHKPTRAVRLGDTIIVEGLAASYTAVPVANAHVEYSVRCDIYQTRKDYLRPWPQMSMSMLPYVGTLTTDELGAFRIVIVDTMASWVPEGGYCSYTFTATVTDLNGETHEESLHINLGKKSCRINIVEKKTPQGTQLQIGCQNLASGTNMSRPVKVQLEQLQMPEWPLLPLNLSFDSTPVLPLGREAYRDAFPLYDYTGTQMDFKKWTVQKRYADRTVDCSESGPGTLDMSDLPSGVYKVKAMAVDDYGDTVVEERYVSHTGRDARQPSSVELLWSEIDQEHVNVGDTLHLRFGSRFDDVTVYVVVNKENDYHETHVFNLSRSIRTLDIPVTDVMVGRMSVSLCAVKANHRSHNNFIIGVEKPDSKLTVAFESFRNKLQPGSQERWTLRIATNSTGQGVAANLAMTMYDHALDNFASLYWRLSPWPLSYTRPCLMTASTGCNYSNDSFFKHLPSDYTIDEDYLHWRDLLTAFFGGSRYVTLYGNTRKRTGSKSGFVEMDEAVFSIVDQDAPMSKAQVVSNRNSVMEVGNAESSDLISANEVAHMPGTLEGEIVAATAGVGFDEAASQKPPVRSNLNTLAFYAPTLRSDSTGAVEVSFTVPDLLTEWSIKGLAWSQNWQVGQLEASAVTQKPLMVVPNVPRYLYQGDTCCFAVKVSNMSDSTQNIELTLEMHDGLSGKTLPMVMGGTVRKLTLKAHTSAVATFILAVPEGDCYMAHYTVVARGQNCSDGETAAVPLLTRRQLVTESMSFYINGVGEKHYELKHLTQLDTAATDFTLRHHAVTAQLTPNPFWLALQCLPYADEHQNPSNIYLANSLYVNSLANKMVNDNPQLKELFEAWSQEEADTLFPSLIDDEVAATTPWLRQMQNEQQQRKQMANYFDHNKIDSRLKTDIDKLLDAQRSDGSWSWIAGGRYSSLYTTQYILSTFGLLQQQGVPIDRRLQKALKRALDYVDAENHSYYVKYLKNKQVDCINLDYLYMRSFYADSKLGGKYAESYNYFYTNAKQQNMQYTGLYSQAQLALVFQRSGDKALAQTMLKRVRQKALRSDEMGMYWRDNVSGYFWYQRPVETQALLIRAFAEAGGSGDDIALMQQWLLKQKQTTSWNSDIATVNAIQALLIVDDKSPLFTPSRSTLTFGSHRLDSDTLRHQPSVARRIAASEILPDDGNIVLRKDDDGIAWGAFFWQYFENQDKIPASETGITIKKNYYHVASGDKLTPLSKVGDISVGDRIRLRLQITVDRNLEYVEINVPRHAALEPVTTASGWRWSRGLSYYLAVTNTTQKLYVDYLNKGTYIVEFDYFVNSAGTYTAAPTTVQCLYAPEFRAVTPSPALKVRSLE
ncbi:MAG: hypothetical protein K5864_00510 [Bacteroidales bacterium]|nr:hypothetical protein [Bacteroidales bacterium]